MKKIIIIAAAIIGVILIVILFSKDVAAPEELEVTQEETEDLEAIEKEKEMTELISLFSGLNTSREIQREFLEWACENIDEEFIVNLLTYLSANEYEEEIFYELFGSSLFVLYDLYTNAPEEEDNISIMEASGEKTILGFTGDVNLDDTWNNMEIMYQQPNGLEDCISEPLMKRLNEIDVLLINNEFTYSDRGEPLPGKAYTFRADPQNVEMMLRLGADIVSLANNHVYDYGPYAFYDTIETLSDAGIITVGAGENIEKAKRPQYIIVNGIKIAYVAASRAEKGEIDTPQAGADSPGILLTYDSELFLDSVREAKQNADLVFTYPHWGTEYSYDLEEEQIQLAHDLIDAGADMVIGAHPHCLQGIEIYNEKMIIYSLGNFWFNNKTLDTALLEVTLLSPSEYSVLFRPCLQSEGKTKLLLEEHEKEAVYDLVKSISQNINFTSEGVVTAEEGTE